MTEPQTIIIDGVATGVARRDTNRGNHLMETVVEQSREYKGATYRSYYPVTFWDERIPASLKDGDRVRVEARVDGRRNQNTGRTFVGLTGLRCEIQGETAAEEWTLAPTETPEQAANDPLPF